MQTKFALRDFRGEPVAYYLVDTEDASTQATKSDKQNSHHIVVIDASGSMWGDLDTVKSVVEKVFTAQEFDDPKQRVSLISYASNGDCRVHFQRVTVADVLAPNSPHLQEIRNLRTRGLTGISQALKVAETLIQDSEVTGISLHSDGYANDPSPYAERQTIDGIVRIVGNHPNVYCNTVAYRDYSDFTLLSSVANKLSGKCVQARSAKDVHDALREAQQLLAGSVSPVIEANIGNNHLVVFASRSAKKILGGAESLKVRGLSPSDDKAIYRYLRVGESAYQASDAPVAGESASLAPILAFSRVQISLGNLNSAKYAMVTTRIPELFQPNARALVGSEVAKMAEDLEKYLFDPPPRVDRKDRAYGLGVTGPSVLSVLSALDTYRSTIRVHLPTLLDNYQRRGLKRVPGTRDAEGKLVKPEYGVRPKDALEWLPVASIDMNRDTATVNVKLVQDAELFETATGNIVREVEGIRLDLKDFRNYTLVSDGQVNVKSLTIQTSDKRCFAALKSLGVVSDTFKPNQGIAINLGELPLVNYDQSFSEVPREAFDKLVRLTTLQKFLSALSKDTSVSFTAEQVAALKLRYLTPNLYFSPPTTNTYTDLEDAVAKGHVDTRISYNITLGTPEIRSLTEIKSGNAYFERRFDLKGPDGKAVAKPKLASLWDKGEVSVKTLSSRTKLTPVDEAMYPVFAEALGLESTGAFRDAMALAGLDVAGQESVISAIAGRDQEAAAEVIQSLSDKVDQAIEQAYRAHVTPLAFFVGATGLVPDSFGASAMTADQFEAKYKVSLSKAEKEGTFYELPGGLILSVFTSAEYFTTEAGLKAASE